MPSHLGRQVNRSARLGGFVDRSAVRRLALEQELAVDRTILALQGVVEFKGGELGRCRQGQGETQERKGNPGQPEKRIAAHVGMLFVVGNGPVRAPTGWQFTGQVSTLSYGN